MNASAKRAEAIHSEPPVDNDEADGAGDSETDVTRQLCERCRQSLADLQLAAENFGVLLLRARR